MTLHESEDRYRALFHLSPVAVYSCDAIGVIQDFNQRAAELWGRSPTLGDTDEQFCGSFKMFLPDGTFMPHAECPMAQVVDGRIPAVNNGEVDIERPDGSRITVIVNIRPLKNTRGEIAGAINCFYDITERRQMERTLQQQTEILADLHRRKDEFLAMLSHELRSPLAPIANAVQVLRLQLDASKLQHEARLIIERQVGQLTRLVDDLMEVSRITTGRIQLRLDRVIVNGVVEQAIEAARPMIEQRQHTLTVSLPSEPIWLHADASRLQQVVVNLLINAAKYTDQGGRIWLNIEQEGDQCVLRVRDSGVGIAPDVLPHMFDLFTQAERSIDRSEGGLGIGLALVQRIVEMHAGRVEVHSDLGRGSEFAVYLPTMTSPASQTFSTPEEILPGGTRPLRVLIVDDHPDTADSLGMLVNMVGHEIRTSNNGRDTLQVALDYKPEAVLLDIGLPGLDGYQVARQMRAHASLKDVTLIALTGYGSESDRQRSLEAGFDHHLVKPVDFGKLQIILASVKTSNSTHS